MAEDAKKSTLGSVGFAGLLAGVVGFVADLNHLLENVKKFIESTTSLPGWTLLVVFGVLVTLGVLSLARWRARRSRILRPEALRLDRDDPQHLVGREEDIQDLLQRCKANAMTFIEGESGSGKSALLRAGLLPKLRETPSILPLLVDAWGDHWERGPASSLRQAMIDSKAALPSCVEPGSSALARLEAALVSVGENEHRTPLLLFDQFDDYQTRNRSEFLSRKTWVTPKRLRDKTSSGTWSRACSPRRRRVLCS